MGGATLGRTLALAGLLLVLTAAAVYVYVIRPPQDPRAEFEAAQKRMAQEAATRREAAPEEPKGLVGHFAVYKDVGGKGPVVAALRPKGEAATTGLNDPEKPRGPLAREVVCQAVLVAARDELGARTRDELLGEPLPATPAVARLDVVVPDDPNGTIRLEARGGDGQGEPTWSQEVKFERGGSADYVSLVEGAEALSRGAFRQALARAGVEDRSRAGGADTPPDGLAARLGKPTLTAQHEALRALHAAARSDAALAGLSRGYATLGLLSEHHWSPAHKAFEARSLLYAQRLVARGSRPAAAARGRAFALALAGLHRAALAELDVAAKLPADRGSEPMGELVAAFCRFDTQGLATLATGEFEGIGPLLRYLTIEDPTFGREQQLKLVMEALRAEPECLRLADALYDVGDLAELHRATAAAPRVLAMALPSRLKEAPGLPDRVADLIGREADVHDLARALVRAGDATEDAGEPSWATLGRLVQETQFIQARRRLEFLRDSLGVPTRDEVEAALPVIGDHPYRLYIESLALPIDDAAAMLSAGAGRLDRAALDFNEAPMLEDMGGDRADRGTLGDGYDGPPELVAAAMADSDAAYRDLMLATRRESRVRQAKTPLVKHLIRVSPHAPAGAGRLVRDLRQWLAVCDHIDEYARPFADRPAALGWIGNTALLQRRDESYAIAERYLRHYIELSPDAWAYEVLGDLYKETGRLDRWRETLEEFLARTEDHGLQHAHARVEVASYYIARREFSKALPYVEAAAETGAHWALQAAGACYEGLRRWDLAEAVYRQSSERYSEGGGSVEWFLFCQRTGRGDVEAARRFAEDQVAAPRGRLDPRNQEGLLFFDVAADQPRRGIELLRDAPADPSRRLLQMFLADFADEVGDRALRDRAWASIPEADEPLDGLVALLRAAAAKGPDAALDPKALDPLIDQAEGKRKADLCYFAGRFLEHRGRVDDAIALFRRGARLADPTNVRTRTILLHALRRLKIDPDQEDDL
ncbi:MAG TPA: hypothetical protein VG406_18880 [Isosphaeraceae bacterium]|jgi:tetratricopeptide (TPR) repeat protein|nr:hypothetical protein [Isosphaeraceae bacterium]